mgnify:CR=1 FL=1
MHKVVITMEDREISDSRTRDVHIMVPKLPQGLVLTSSVEIEDGRKRIVLGYFSIRYPICVKTELSRKRIRGKIDVGIR